MKKSVKLLVYCAMYCALFIIFDRVSDALNLFKMANGGKLNFGPIVLLLASYHLGYKNTIIVSIGCVLLQFIIGSVTWYGLVGFILDYLLGYSVYSFAEAFKNYGLFYSGILITSILRLLFSTLSGSIVYELNVWASLLYNGAYMLPTTICAIIVVPLLVKSLKPIIHETRN